MAVLIEGSVEIDLRQIVTEAIERLGYFRRESAEELADLYCRIWPHGTSSTMLIYGQGVGEDMSAEEKEEAGISKGRMPRAVWQMLSEKGRKNRRHAIEATTSRVLLNVYKRRDILREPQWSKYVSRVKFAGITSYSCSAARKCEGLVSDRIGRLELPLPDCDSEWCACRWDHMLD